MLKTVGNPSTRYGDQTIIDGNLVVGTAGKGIDFSADPNNPGMTSELLDDYEEGTWTPNADVGLVVVGTFSSSGKYTKIGRLVFVNFSLSATTSISWGAAARIVDNLPFLADNAPMQIANTGSFTSGSHGFAGGQFVYALEAQAATTSVQISGVYTI